MKSLFVLCKWSDIPRLEQGERVEAIEDDEMFDEDFRRANDHQFRAFKSQRMPYTRRDQTEIVNFLGKLFHLQLYLPLK